MKIPPLYAIVRNKPAKVQLQRMVDQAGNVKLFLQWWDGKRPRRVFVGALKPARSSWRNLAGTRSA